VYNARHGYAPHGIPGHYMPGRAGGALLFFVRPKKSNKRNALFLLLVFTIKTLPKANSPKSPFTRFEIL
jgi:hypothetical protein